MRPLHDLAEDDLRVLHVLDRVPERHGVEAARPLLVAADRAQPIHGLPPDLEAARLEVRIERGPKKRAGAGANVEDAGRLLDVAPDELAAADVDRTGDVRA